ncbi:homocysteine-responsive endoplasmic reticulum-resident ubiquitin-like domain member 1 protein [Acanthochromis polyacanthus]|uniref:Homocysteine-inducible, endoplasmic reticulum stress-inducible, ubiquitin-like domain member 1 n=1 Tax=Acanthochromis polyacanthus TaxID=80966 RepID=A0A3Q1GX79_9TELE|nr:homocysteine-responsive endoplasmic reticulum-resident ubiquitin-like domain member 1 protein [Acanthochromis polyacanthus]
MDPGEAHRQTTSLLVKTPNQTQEDRTVDGVRLDWTVRELKEHLSALYPSKPAVSDQRLIYSGKLLPDHLQLRALFRQTDSVPTLHLVCSVTSPPAGGKTQTSTAPPAAPPELRQRRNTSSSAAQTPAAGREAPQINQPTFPSISLYSPQQLLWLQHVYAQQYYMQYHAALAAAGSAPSTPAPTIGQYPPVPAHQVPVPAPLANQNPIDNLPVNQNPAQDGAFLNPGEANQNLRMNAQGGPVMEDEEEVERDWLDWMYSAARFGVLLMIVYFNSNLTRFLLVMSTLLLMYLHTVGRFPFRRRVQVLEPNLQQHPEVQHNQQNQNLNPGGEAAAEGSDGSGPMTAVLVPPHRVSVMWTAWVFFKTFFSSLIPEVPQAN